MFSLIVALGVIRLMRTELEKMSRSFIEAMSKVRGGWWMLLQIAAIAMALGGLGA